MKVAQNGCRVVQATIRRNVFNNANFVYLASRCVQSRPLRHRSKKIRTPPPELLRQNEIAIDAVPDLDIINSKHVEWEEMINQISDMDTKSSNYKNISDIRALWNDINATISAEIEQSMQSTQRNLNFSEISSLINNILPPTLILNVLKLCSNHNDIQLLLTIHEFLVYHQISLNNNIIILILNCLNEHDQYQQNAINIFNNYINTFLDKNKKSTSSISKRDQLRMKRKQKRMSSSSLPSNENTPKTEEEASESLSFQTTTKEDNNEIEHVSEKPDLVLFNCALNNFSKMNDLAFSSMTFEMMKKMFDIQPDEFSFNALLKSCMNIDDAMDIFKEMIENENIEVNTETFNALLNVYYKSLTMKNQENKNINLDEGVKLFYSMIKDFNVDPNGDTFTILFKLCAECKNMEMCLNLLQFMIKHCVETVELSNNLIAAFIECCVNCDKGKLGMKFYEDMFLFGDNYQMSKKKQNENKTQSKWDLSELNSFQRHSVPNVNIFVYLLDSAVNKKGIYSENVTFIQSQMKKYDIKPNVEFYNKLLGIADQAKQMKEMQKLCQLVLKNMHRGSIEYCRDTLEFMIKLLYKYELYENAQQVYDFYYRELGLIDHWMNNETSQDDQNKNMKRRRRRLKNQQEEMETKNSDVSGEGNNKLDLRGYDSLIGAVAIKQVLSTEWTDFGKDLYVKIGSKQNFDEVVKCMEVLFVPSLTDHMQFNENDDSFVIQANNIKLWILYQANMGRR